MTPLATGLFFLTALALFLTALALTLRVRYRQRYRRLRESATGIRILNLVADGMPSSIEFSANAYRPTLVWDIPSLGQVSLSASGGVRRRLEAWAPDLRRGSHPVDHGRECDPLRRVPAGGVP